MNRKTEYLLMTAAIGAALFQFVLARPPHRNILVINGKCPWVGSCHEVSSGRLGEIVGGGMKPDGEFDQTESATIHFGDIYLDERRPK